MPQASAGGVLHRGAPTAGGSGRLVARSPASLARPAALTGVPATLYGTPSKLAARTSPQQPRKKIKLEERLSSTDEVTLKRQNVLDYKLDRAAKLREQYDDLTAELYYLEDGGSLMDFPGWLKRPPLQFLNYKKRMLLDSEDEEDAAEVKVPASGGTPVAVSSTLPSSISKLAHIKGGAATPVAPRGPGRPAGSGLGSSHDAAGTEHMVEKAKQEAQVMQRISDLRKQGLWSEKRLPKVAEPKRIKAHWDYLLEEMQWLAADFAQERKWKKAAARKCARMVQKYHQDKAAAAEKAVKDQERDLRRVAAFVAREIRTFWANAEKLVEFKITARLDEKRKKALDQHLNFIVDQTEKYSEKLQEALQQNSSQPSRASSSCGQPSSRLHSDGEFEPDSGSEDDEETIARAERDVQQHDTTAEVSALQKESEMSLDDVLDQLPPGYLENRHRDVPDPDKDASAAGSDDDFEAASDADSDDEETIAEQEGAEKQQDHAMEISQLEAGLSGPAEITDVAALAETFQPKGYTLSSTTVKTPVPFLLKHSLREYQHVGLEWLVTMYDKKLNGILADEMGLGKTIQTIALLAHLACQQGIWGPHLIVVPTSVMLNWEIELKKWCPAFKVLTYYGSQKERRQKRTGWTKQNSFHVCITSYKLVLQDHASFRRKKWKYLILDEAQNIKNFKSQRWQLLLNFQSQRRLLLTGTPLQNNLMELWSLMHFLMPHVFASHREFKEWFSNPVSGMIEGNTEYNESIIKRLHKVLRPFLLRRLKTEVEKQLPKKYEHAIMCRLSKRQRYLYDEFMSRTKTKETLATGNFLSVINILMQLRKVCNHPDMFEPRPTVSPYRMERLEFVTASSAWTALQHDPFKHVDLKFLNLLLADLELTLTAFAAHRTRRFQAPRRLIEEVDQRPPPPPRCPAGRIKLHVRATPPTSSAASGPPAPPPPPRLPAPAPATPAVPRPVVPGAAPLRGYALQVVQGGVVKTIPLSSLSGVGGGPLALQIQQTPQGPRLVPAASQPSATASTAAGSTVSTPVSAGIVLQTGKPLLGSPGPRPLGNGARLTTPATVDPQSLAAMLAARGLPANTNVTFARLTPAAVAAAPRPAASNALVGSVPAQPAVSAATGPERRVNAASPQSVPLRAQAPAPPPPQPPPSAPQANSLPAPRPTPPASPSTATRSASAAQNAKHHSVFRIPALEEQRRIARKEKLLTLYRINKRRCEACPIYGADLVQSVRVVDGAGGRVPAWNGLAHCVPADPCQSGAAATRRYWRQTEHLDRLLPTIPQLLERMHDILSRYVVYTPGVVAPEIRLHVSHPPPWRLQEERWRRLRLTAELSPRTADLHPIASAMATQFPERRLIQYDCGKLQVMDRLLHKLKSEGHRVLIFTQMTRMLDILEQFLNFHGHIYLRLDGTTRVDQRQALMERFNADKRIFCFILSTRSGGVGVNLTGADTVVFYDSDWNPTMDAQAQDRCHRIGQTRDVHIYRLVSDKTIEENIVKKANQKRLLGDLAIEGGNFTTAFFKKNTLQDLFNVDMREDDASRRMSDAARRRPEKVEPSAPPAVTDRSAEVAFETALAAAEDETDVRAACTARAEADADMAEFDENIPLDDGGDEEISKAELEVQQLVKQLTPIERWAMAFVEETDDGWQREADRAAAEIDARKREWEADHQQAMRQHDGDSEGAAGSDTELTYDAAETSQVRTPRANTPSTPSCRVTLRRCDEPTDSPKTRSRSTVDINLWTLDTNPLLPGEKPVRNGTGPPPARATARRGRLGRQRRRPSGD
ncbi:Helicase domino [Amphibalanus amphitrite]|uniref:Helicase domino n=1 Tax=Amphibalanus amphitrite TaxID=1232801 RepID=A0A6A4V6G4_AMPAM|nr:Helicase domino [Amphibalanus amphitrite]